MKLGAAYRRDHDRSLGRADRIQVPGYRLIERLEGPGEVWSAEGPGGFRAALRIVRPGPGVDPAALQAVVSDRRTRHPNIQAAFASWRLGPLLVFAAELPDGSLWDRFREAAAAGLGGVPRGELIEALAEAARAIDYLNNAGAEGPGLAHGDIAPRTILRVGGGVKIPAVDPVRLAAPEGRPFGPPLFPLYAAPERLAGGSSPQSDQYSLAVTYGHLRIGRLPSAAELSGLPGAERAVVARALSDDPDRRWPSCRAFVDALRDAQRPALPVAHAPLALPGADGPAPEFADGPPGRTSVGRSTAFALAAATGAATLAGTLWFRGVFLPSRGRAGTDLRADAPDLATFLARGTASPPPRVRLQDPGDERIPAVRPALVAAHPRGRQGPPDGPEWHEAVEGPGRPTPVAPPPEIRLKAPESLTVRNGRPSVVNVAVTLLGEVGPILVRIDGLPNGVECDPMTLIPGHGPEPAGRLNVPVRVSAEAPAGETVVRLVATSGGVQAEAKVRLKVHPTPPLAARRKADTLLSRGEYPAARLAYALALRLDPDDPLSYHGRGLASFNLGDHARARADFDAAIRLKPDAPTALNDRGLTHLALGDPARALADFDAAVLADPDFALARYNRGRALDRAGSADAALADYDAAIRLDPGFAKAYRARASNLDKRGDRVRARADYEAAIRLNPNDTAARNNLGLVLAALGEPLRALAEFDAALRVDPSYTLARDNRRRIEQSLTGTAASPDDPGPTDRRADIASSRPSLGSATRVASSPTATH